MNLIASILELIFHFVIKFLLAIAFLVKSWNAHYARQVASETSVESECVLQMFASGVKFINLSLGAWVRLIREVCFVAGN